MNWNKVMSGFRLFLQVDVIIALGGFSALLLNPLTNEYMYLKVAESHNATNKAISDCNSNTSNAVDQLVADEVSRLTLLMDMTLFIPASVAGIIINSWSDKVGRRVAIAIPLVGMTIGSLVLALSVQLRWRVETLYIYNLITGSGGFYTTMLIQGIAYLSDITPSEKRGKRFVILETSLGVAGGVAGIVSGYWVDAQGFFYPVLSTLVLNVVGLILIPLLPDSGRVRDEKNRKKEEEVGQHGVNDLDDYPEGFHDEFKALISEEEERSGAFSSISLSSGYGSCTDNNNLEKKKTKEKYTLLDLMKSVWKVYSTEYSHCEKCHGPLGSEPDKNMKVKCIHGGGLYSGRIWRMWFYLFSYDLYMFVNVGTMLFQTIFFLSKPLCFTPVLVGAQLALKFATIALAPFVVIFYQRALNMSNKIIIFTGLLGVGTFTTVMSFATHSYIVFVATAMMLFANPAKPFIQAQISNMVSESEQGAAFALISSTELITFFVTTAVFLTLYPATVEIYHGFAWLFATAITLVPICLILTIIISDKRKEQSREGEREPMIT